MRMVNDAAKHWLSAYIIQVHLINNNCVPSFQHLAFFGFMTLLFFTHETRSKWIVQILRYRRVVVYHRRLTSPIIVA
jgi:hypothetical protein